MFVLVRRGMSNTCMLLCNRPRIEARANPFEQNPAGVPRDPCYIAFSSDRAFFCRSTTLFFELFAKMHRVLPRSLFDSKAFFLHREFIKSIKYYTAIGQN